MEPTYAVPDLEDPDALAEDNTRPSLPEDFPNFRDFQIEKMVQHFRVVTDGSEQRLRLGFKCKLCNEVFNKTMQLLGHIRNHFEDNHSCRDCGKYFFDTNKLNIHKRAKHTQALRCQLGCPSYTTSNIKCLQTHYLRYHCVKVRPREMKKMDALGTLFRVSEDSEPKIRIRRGQLADEQRDFSGIEQQLPVAQQLTQINIQQVVQEVEEEEEEGEEEEEDEEIEEEAELASEEQADLEPEPEEDEFDELDDSEQPVECCVCDVYIPNEETLREHEETSHASPYSCKICSSAFEQLEDARSHYETHEKLPVLQSPTQIQTITLAPGQHLQQTAIPIVAASSHHQQHQQQAPTPTVTTMIIMHNGQPVLVPVQTFDSSQLLPAFPAQQPQQTQHQHPPPGTATLTPITTAWPISQLMPVQNQIEIIPIHSAAGAHHQQAIPIQNIINVRHEPATQSQAGGIVITPIDQNYLRHQQALQAQLHLQQQLQQVAQQQQQQHYQPQS